jgi:hypothetical protein
MEGWLYEIQCMTIAQMRESVIILNAPTSIELFSATLLLL